MNDNRLHTSTFSFLDSFENGKLRILAANSHQRHHLLKCLKEKYEDQFIMIPRSNFNEDIGMERIEQYCANKLVSGV